MKKKLRQQHVEGSCLTLAAFTAVQPVTSPDHKNTPFLTVIRTLHFCPSTVVRTVNQNHVPDQLAFCFLLPPAAAAQGTCTMVLRQRWRTQRATCLRKLGKK